MTDNSEAPVTLITGASRGIGEYLSRHYAALGHRVIGCSRSRPERPVEGSTHFGVDIRDEAAVRRVFAEIRRQHGRLDHLVNSAGTASMNHSLVTPIDVARRILDTNLIGTFLFCREAAKLMRKHRRGRIVNLSTVAVPLKLAGEAIYAASKAAVETLTAILARELADFGITVNAVGPAPVETDLTRSIPREKLEQVLARLAIPEMGTFEEVAHVVDFYLAPESGSVTGQVLYLRGP